MSFFYLTLIPFGVNAGWDSYTHTEVVQTVVVQDRSITNSLEFSDTSQTEKTVKVNLIYHVTDKEFHDFYVRDVRGKSFYKKDPANTIDLEINYTLNQSYQQYWIRFGYTIDNFVESSNDMLTLDLTPRFRMGDLTIDRYTLNVKIPVYKSYFYRISIRGITVSPDSQTEEGDYLVMTWQRSGREFGTHVVIRYQYDLNSREVQNILLGAVISGAISFLVGYLTARLQYSRQTKREDVQLIYAPLDSEVEYILRRIRDGERTGRFGVWEKLRRENMLWRIRDPNVEKAYASFRAAADEYDDGVKSIGLPVSHVSEKIAEEHGRVERLGISELKRRAIECGETYRKVLKSHLK